MATRRPRGGSRRHYHSECTESHYSLQPGREAKPAESRSGCDDRTVHQQHKGSFHCVTIQSCTSAVPEVTARRRIAQPRNSQIQEETLYFLERALRGHKQSDRFPCFANLRGRSVVTHDRDAAAAPKIWIGGRTTGTRGRPRILNRPRPPAPPAAGGRAAPPGGARPRPGWFKFAAASTIAATQ